VQLLPSLHAVAEERRQRLAKLPTGAGAETSQSRDAAASESKSDSAGEAAGTGSSSSGLRLVQGNIFQADFSGGDVVFCASTAFSDKLMAQLATACEKLKTGARVLTLSSKLPSNAFKVSWTDKYRQSWGNVTVFCQVKT
jgi:hypothetical protein